MKHLSKVILKKALLMTLSVAALGIVVGCTSEFAEQFDISNLYYAYEPVDDGNGQYIVITKHIVSQSDVKIPNTIYGIPVKKIADSVFAGDKAIQTVTFGENVEIIGSDAFGGCEHLESVTFNDALAEIGQYAFRKCTSLTSVTLPENIQSVGRGAFYGCKALGEVSVPQGIGYVGGRAFGDTPWLASRNKEEFVTVGNGILIAYNGKKKDVVLPSGITQISGAFAGNKNIRTMILSDGVTSIGDMAFMGCTSFQITSIPASLYDIGANAFYGCSSMGGIVLSENIRSIGSDAFANCSARLTVRKDSYAEKYCVENGLPYVSVK